MRSTWREAACAWQLTVEPTWRLWHPDPSYVPGCAVHTHPCRPVLPPFLRPSCLPAVLAECNYDVNEATSRLIDSERQGARLGGS